MDAFAIHGKPAILADLVDYQTDAVVSKIIVKGGYGSVTAFAFDEGQDLSEHTVPFDAMVYILDGEAEIRIAGDTHRLTTGEAVVMPADQPHAVKAVRRFKMVLSMIKG